MHLWLSVNRSSLSIALSIRNLVKHGLHVCLGGDVAGEGDVVAGAQRSLGLLTAGGRLGVRGDGGGIGGWLRAEKWYILLSLFHTSLQQSLPAIQRKPCVKVYTTG